MPLTEENDIDYWNNDEPICPYCDYKIDISTYEMYELYEDNDTHEIDCPSCGKVIKVITICSYTFSTDEME